MKPKFRTLAWITEGGNVRAVVCTEVSALKRMARIDAAAGTLQYSCTFDNKDSAEVARKEVLLEMRRSYRRGQ